MKKNIKKIITYLIITIATAMIINLFKISYPYNLYCSFAAGFLAVMIANNV